MAADESLRRVHLPLPLGPAADDRSLTFDAPATWQPGPIPQPVAIFREPVSGRDFRANVVVTIDRAGPLTKAATASALTLRETRRHADAVGVVAERALLLDGHDAAIREQIVVGPGEPPLLQCVATVVVDVDGGAARSCIQFTVSVPAARAATGQRVFADLLRSVSFAQPGG